MPNGSNDPTRPSATSAVTCRAAILFFALFACVGAAPPIRGADFAPREERVGDLAALVPARRVEAPTPRVMLERVTTAVPWPRGLAFVDGELIVLARGRHRRAGGIDATVDDQAGSLFAVDPSVAEPVAGAAPVGDAVRSNARLLAAPSSPPFQLYDPAVAPIESTAIDRPYCTLVSDGPSRNLFICGFSGVDLPGEAFRKNATDSIHRFDLRSGAWYAVEQHDPSVVPASELGYVVPNHHFPHHDPRRRPPPHGWLNGANGGCTAGAYLYIAAKDNHRVVQYDLEAIRRDPAAPPPASRPVLDARAPVRHPGGTTMLSLLGPSAVAARDGFLYVGYRTTSVVVRFAIDETGNLVSAVGELIAVFDPWDPGAQHSADLIDIAFNGRGELFVACASQGRVWNVGVPDPAAPFCGVDRARCATTAPPAVDLPRLLGRPARCGNIAFDDRDRLYICSGTYEATGGRDGLPGVVYRATFAPGP